MVLVGLLPAGRAWPPRAERFVNADCPASGAMADLESYVNWLSTGLSPPGFQTLSPARRAARRSLALFGRPASRESSRTAPFIAMRSSVPGSLRSSTPPDAIHSRSSKAESTRPPSPPPPLPLDACPLEAPPLDAPPLELEPEPPAANWPPWRWW